MSASNNEATTKKAKPVTMACRQVFPTRMRGKAQPDGRPALQIIKTPFLYFSPLLDQSTRATPLFG